MVEPYRILIIEDDPEHTDLIRMSFKKHDEVFLDFASTGELSCKRLQRPNLSSSDGSWPSALAYLLV